MNLISVIEVVKKAGLSSWWSRLKKQYKSTTTVQKLFIHAFDTVYLLGFALSIVAVTRFAMAPSVSATGIFVLVGGSLGFMLSVLSVFLDCWWWTIFIGENAAERKVGRHKWLLGYTLIFVLANLIIPIVALAVSHQL